MSAVELGFLKKTASWKLGSKFFPSKVGGKPSWLTLNNIPEPSELVCKSCQRPLIFLLQVYANIDERDDTFHRSVFVFMCSNGKCIKKFSNENFSVFRSQLPRKNDFYSFEPPLTEEKSPDIPSAAEYQNICDACGCKAVLTCEKCSKKYYCSEFHKNEDWNSHKEHCGVDSKKKKKPSNQFLLPEYEIECDTEYLPTEEPEKSDAEKMKEYDQFMKSSQAPKEQLQDCPLEDFDSIIKKNDKAFNKFRKRMQHNPEQILRYERNGDPLLVSSDFVPTETDVPLCQCGAKRIFEFQIMSPILLYLSLDTVEESPDWGTLLIYTCSKSCEAGTGAYVREFLWKQDFSDSQ